MLTEHRRAREDHGRVPRLAPGCRELQPPGAGFLGASQEGQVLMESMLRERLKLVKRDPEGIPEKLVLFRAQRKPGSVDVVINPRFSFGRPILDGIGVRTSVLAERFLAGEMVGELAQDYGITDIDGRVIPSLRDTRGTPIWQPV